MIKLADGFEMPEQEPLFPRNPDRKTEYLHQGREGFGERIERLVPQMAMPTEQEHPDERQPRAPEKENNSALVDAEKMIENIEQMATELLQKNMEHRVGDFRDGIPILANIRSHDLAVREGEVIGNIKREFVDLQAFAARNNLRIDLSLLQDSILPLKQPAGATMWLATLIPGMRMFHRSIVVPQFEKLREVSSNLKRSVQRDLRA